MFDAEKTVTLYYRQKETLDTFLANGSISQKQYDKSFGDLTRKMPLPRCPWAGSDDPLTLDYHDFEWGKPVHDDNKLFEMLILEGFQAGLSRSCILKKREAFRRAYADFIPAKVALFDEKDVERLLSDPEIVGNKNKIESSVKNARVFCEIAREFGSFDAYLRSYTGHTVIVEPDPSTTHSALSDDLSADLSARGMKYVESEIIYSFLQAVGVIDGHCEGCFLRR